ncbi:MAG: aromatic ring-hydroxylating dioxygenase subunit alpha [Pirellulales bacterium]
MHRTDVERVFLRHWLLAGHVASIPRPGDYFLYDVGYESFVVVRGEGDAVHALANVCRHRGSRVCIEEYGHVRQYVCPMHGWAYRVDGRLECAPNMPADFDRSSYGLVTAKVEVVDGIIFMCPNDGGDFSAVHRDICEFLAPYELAETRIAYHRRYLCPANWKLVAEIFLELQTTGGAFPQMRQVMARAAAAVPGNDEAMRKLENFAAAWRASTHSPPQRPARGGAEKHAAVEIDYTCQREPIRPDFVTQSEDGRAVAPLLGSQTESDGGVTAIRVLAAWIIVCSDYAAIVRFTPLEAQVTEMDVTWLVRSTAVEGVDYDASRVSWLWRANVERTLKLASDNQLGVNSQQYCGGPYAPDEAAIDEWVTWYLVRFV